MHLVIDPKIISERPRLFFQILTSGQDPSEVGKTTKWQEAEAVRSYLSTFFFAAPRVLILRRWAYVGQQTAEFIVRPDPDALEQGGQSISMALVCRLNPQTKTLEVVRPGVVDGEPELEIEQYWEGELDALNIYSHSRSDEGALAFLENLPEIGADIDRPLQDWSRYLDWRQKLAEDKANQVYAYTEFEPGRGRFAGTVRFYLKEPNILEKLKLRFIGESMRATLSDNPADRGLYQGDFSQIEAPGVPDPVRGRGHYHSRRNGDPEGRPEKLVVALSAPREADPETSVDVSTIPDAGFLRLAMEGEFAAVEFQRNGLRRLAEYRGLNPNLRDWLFDIRKARPCPQPAADGQWQPDQSLNARQRDCVAKSLVFDDLLLLWGPPGTGKTTVIAEISSQFCRRGQRVLVSSQANLAVDQALDKLPKLPHIRPARVKTGKRKEGMGVDARDWIKRWLNAIAAEAKKAAKTEPDMLWKGMLSDWASHLHEVQPADFSEDFESSYLSRANVIGATCLETGKPEFRSGVRFDARFDLSIVDEVSKATPPELLLPALMGCRTLLVGDHRQLPPVFKDSTFPEALENGEISREDLATFREMVSTSLFEGYFRNSDPSIQCALNEQYRMHPHIMQAVNLFYADSPLLPGGGAEVRSEDRKHSIQLRDITGRPWLNPGKHLIWIDTEKDERGRPVQNERVSSSRRNHTEATLCRHLVAELYRSNPELEIGVISFYRPQVQAIARSLHETRIPRLMDFIRAGGVNTVDQFQGSERDVIIVSLARTDPQLTGEFVSDFRRINVAFSRAKRLLIILGSGRTFDSGEVTVPQADGSGDESIRAYQRLREMAARSGGQFRTTDILSAPTASHPSPKHQGKPRQPASTQPFNKPTWRNSGPSN